MAADEYIDSQLSDAMSNPNRQFTEFNPANRNARAVSIDVILPVVGLSTFIDSSSYEGEVDQTQVTYAWGISRLNYIPISKFK